MSEHYRKYENLIRKSAWNRVRRNPRLDFDECVAVGNLAYAEALDTWDESRGCFSTHLYWRLRHRLGAANAQAIDDDNHLAGLDQAADAADPGDPFEACSFQSALDCLGEEAREVVGLILGSAGELVDFTASSVKVTRGNIRNYLRSLRWPGRKIDKAMKEIKDMLKNLYKGENYV